MNNVNLLAALVISLALSACGEKQDATAPAMTDAKINDSLKQNPPCYPHCTAGDLLKPQK